MNLTIEKLIFGGLGLARTDTGIVFVEQALPEEEVVAAQCGLQGGVPVYRISEIVNPSPVRCKPVCPVYGVCGGCDLQYASHDAQVGFKRDIFLESLRRIGKIIAMPAPEIFSSPQWGYRMRCQFKLDRQKKSMGFYQRQTNSVVAIDRCPLLVDSLNELFTRQGAIVDACSQHTSQIKAIAGTDGSVASMPVIPGITKSHTEVVTGDIRFRVSGDSFFQGNRFLLEAMGAWARPYCGGKFFIDLFGGLGFFSMMLGKNFDGGVLVEIETSQAQCAQENFKSNGFSHLEAVALTAEMFFNKKVRSYPQPDSVVVDPPRSGLKKEVRRGIGRLSPGTIVYISCNPSTQARDVGYFVNECGYVIERCAMFDLYPQTHHLETGVVLRKGV